MIVRITDLNNHSQAICHHTEVENTLISWFKEPTDEIRGVITDVANAAAAPHLAPDYVALCDWLGIEIDHLAPEEEPIQYTLTPEALALIDGK